MKSQPSSSLLYKKQHSGLPQKIYLFIKWRGAMFLLLFFFSFFYCFKLYSSITIRGYSLVYNEDSTLVRNNETCLAAQEKTFLYGVMMDAGSTGSRVHVYKFRNSPSSMAPILCSELFEQVEPGLSSYADKPKEGAASIQKLLKIAQNEVPEKLWNRTVLALKATAGLRLLPKKQADDLLDEVRLLFKNSPFKLLHKPVEIMDGTDEGIFGWITVNYLLERLGSSKKDQFTVGTIDLGGGSVQLSFAPHQKESVDDAMEGSTHKVSVFGRQLTLYTHSYLGLGLMSAREATLKNGECAGTSVQSPCLPINFNQEYQNGQKKYTIEGIGVASSSYTFCRETTRSAVSNTMQHPLKIRHQSFYIFSYFFDRAVDMKMIDKEKGGTLTVQDYIDAAQRACSFRDFNKTEPFLCLDMSVIASILQDGFEFSADTRLVTKRTINNKETSWTLGATFSLLH